MPRKLANCRLLATLLLVASTPVAFTAETAAPAPTLALDNARIIEPSKGQVGPPRCVRIEGARITRITAPGSGSCRHDAESRDLKGRYLLPGFIDMNAHLALES
jgi:imidazolonepropionase-like amidohydrolase